LIIFYICRLNGTHIWIGGGFVPPFEIKDPLEVEFEEDKKARQKVPKRTTGGKTLKKAWFFDGFSWIPTKSMGEERNKAACSLVIDKDGEVNVQI
jgi:hypothetical protein